ncbi:MAG TPA: hypothetical protein VGM39_03635 [Kofleriaceae bacterium]|jgi:hypothetical protein
MSKLALVRALCTVATSVTGCAKAMIATGAGMTILGGLTLASDASPTEPDDPYHGDPGHPDTRLAAGMLGVGFAMILGGMILYDNSDTGDAKQQLATTMTASNPFANQSALSMRGGL